MWNDIDVHTPLPKTQGKGANAKQAKRAHAAQQKQKKKCREEFAEIVAQTSPDITKMHFTCNTAPNTFKRCQAELSGRAAKAAAEKEAAARAAAEKEAAARAAAEKEAAARAAAETASATEAHQTFRTLLDRARALRTVGDIKLVVPASTSLVDRAKPLAMQYRILLNVLD